MAKCRYRRWVVTPVVGVPFEARDWASASKENVDCCSEASTTFRSVTSKYGRVVLVFITAIGVAEN